MIYQISGLFLLLTGTSHLFSWTQAPEFKLVEALQELVIKTHLLNIFKEIWFLGKTAFTIIVLLFLSAIDWKLGLTAAVVFILTVGIEQLIKLAFNRRRPFEVHETIQMLQPEQPNDASFPSGDTLRIWFLALILSIAAGSNPLVLLALILLAALVSLGRIAMGVHYLTDILAGAGLGILGAGTTIWLWYYFSLL